MLHNDGYGMHINTRNQERGKYGLEVHNGARTTFHVLNDGEIIQYRKDNRATHFDHANGENYIRGHTNVDNNLTVGGNLSAANFIGIIVMWSGAANAIPAGWKLCDGRNGTPDLRDRFVIGAGSGYAVGASGGNNTISLNVAQLPAHSHTGGTGWMNQNNVHSHGMDAAGKHGHGVHDNVGSIIRPAFGHQSTTGLDSAWDAEVNIVTHPRDQGGGFFQHDGSHTHGIGNADINHTHNFTTNNTGSGAGIDIRPLYYALAYIMKT